MDQSVNPTIVDEAEALIEQLVRARNEIGRVVFGQDRVVDQVLTGILADGHILIVGVPGLAKTLLAETMGRVLGLDQKRVQFTPDLMPYDILGSEILDQAADGSRQFRFVPGPVICQLLMADEINRASPRTQSALLQAMQEKVITINGADHVLPKPFHVLATQNPLEHEGTYALPEAQLDRFLLQVQVDYPDAEDERRIIVETTQDGRIAPAQVFTAESLIAAQRLAETIPVGEQVVDAILKLVRTARPGEPDAHAVTKHLRWGPGPRAAQALMRCCRVQAMLDGRFTPSIDDVIAVAPPVLRHRLAMQYDPSGPDMDHIIAQLCAQLG